MLSPKFYVRLLLCIALTSFGTVEGVVIKTGNGSGNNSAPEDDPGFANVGRVGVGSGIYLGNRWVLTANHVGARSITFGGETFDPVPGESTRVSNPLGRGISASTDMVLYRISEEPDLPDLRIGCRAPRIGDQLLLMGHGRDRVAQLSAWDVQTGLGNNDDVWTPTTNLPAADQVGFGTESNRTLRWGFAPVTRTNTAVRTASNGEVISIETTFDDFGDGGPFPGLANVEDLSRAVSGDSGGPAFRKNGDFWELVGMMHGVTPPRENQPGGTSTVLFGTVTYIADLLVYEGAIRAVAEFGPAPGDFNNDGEIDATDIDRIFSAFENQDHNCNYDLSGNGLVTRADIDLLLNEAGTILGDADLDGTIGFTDFLLLARSFGEEDRGWGGGDFDGDGSTNFGDFIQLSSSFGDSFEGVEQSAAITAVPEPDGFSLVLLAVFIGLARFRVTRRRRF